ncbi:hypothetical protein HD806DRAFT_116816 [Xylariaceae sp. AK1471]|nr:hypothetical protein HD806DRAFT_116816 [Xylariaceae sp. AK1471]
MDENGLRSTTGIARRLPNHDDSPLPSPLLPPRMVRNRAESQQIGPLSAGIVQGCRSPYGSWDNQSLQKSQRDGFASFPSLRMPNGRWRCRHPCSNSAVTRSGNLCKHKCCHEGLDKAPNSCSPPANMSGHDTEYDEIAEEDLLNALETIERSSQPATIDSSSMSDCCDSDLRQIEDWLSLVAFHRIPEQIPHPQHLHTINIFFESSLTQVTMSNAWAVGTHHRRILHVNGWPRQTPCEPIGLHPNVHWSDPTELHEACNLLGQRYLNSSDIKAIRGAFVHLKPSTAHADDTFLGSVY